MIDSNEGQSFVNELIDSLKMIVVFILFMMILAMTRDGMRYLGDWFGIALRHRLVLMVSTMSLISVAFFVFVRFVFGLGNDAQANQINEEPQEVD